MCVHVCAWVCICVHVCALRVCMRVRAHVRGACACVTGLQICRVMLVGMMLLMMLQELEDSIEGLIHHFFGHLERYHGVRLVTNTVGLLCASRTGASASAAVSPCESYFSLKPHRREPCSGRLCYYQWHMCMCVYVSVFVYVSVCVCVCVCVWVCVFRPLLFPLAFTNIL